MAPASACLRTTSLMYSASRLSTAARMRFLVLLINSPMMNIAILFVRRNSYSLGQVIQTRQAVDQ